MYTAGTGENGLAVVVDARKAEDKELDSVLEFAPWLIKPLGKKQHQQTLRIAIRECGEPPLTAAEHKKIQPDVWRIIREHKIKAAIIVSGGKVPKSTQKPGHDAWAIMGRRNGSSYKWAGTALFEDNIYKCPILPPWMYEPIFCYLTHRWVKSALLLAQGKMRPFPFPPTYVTPNETQFEALENIIRRHEPTGIDIETTLDRRYITAIGIADSQVAVSVPWDSFKTMAEETEPGIDAYDLGSQIKQLTLNILSNDQEKILHNGAFDIVELSKRQIEVNNYCWDTLLLHRVAYPQFPHGLQFAAATEFCVAPWKALHKPPKCPKGFNKEAWDPWAYNPLETREYNARDAAIEIPLLMSLRKKVGV